MALCRQVPQTLTRIQAKKCNFPHPFSNPAFRQKVMLSLLRLERKQKRFSNPFRIRIFLFLAYSFGIETINTFIHSVVPSKTIPYSRPKWTKCIPAFSDQNGAKSLPDGAAPIYMAYIREYPPGIQQSVEKSYQF